MKKENTDQETIVSVRSALQKLKAMIREDGNKLAALQGGVQSETKYYKRGELVSADPYPEYSSDPNAAKALSMLPLLKNCEAHSTVILPAVDDNTFRRLGLNLSCDPAYQTHKLFHG